MATFSKPQFGSKERLDAAIESGAINQYDTIHLDNGEFGWMDGSNNLVMNTPRTQTDIVVNGVTGLGVEDGGTIPAGLTMDQFVKMMVQKAIHPTYTAPKITFVNNSGTAAGTYEAGTTIYPKIKATFTQNNAGALSGISVTKDGSEVGTSTTSPYEFVGEEFVIGDSSVSFQAKASYADGDVLNNNLEQPDAVGQIMAGTISSSNVTFTGARNAFYGTTVGELGTVDSGVVRGLANKKISPKAGTVLEFKVAVGQQNIIFAYPSTIRDVNQVTYVEANDNNMAVNFTKTTVQVADARGESNGLMDYKVYTYHIAAPAEAEMTFKVTI